MRPVDASGAQPYRGIGAPCARAGVEESRRNVIYRSLADSPEISSSFLPSRSEVEKQTSSRVSQRKSGIHSPLPA